ncbi:hypothetical protein GCAAIG_12140 [Candidatus Electronema halotolerans]
MVLMKSFSLRKENIILLLILLLALAARLYIWFDFLGKPSYFIQPDTSSYLHPGMQLIENGTFPSFSRTPVYPIFIAFIHKYISSSNAVMALIQVFISVAAVLISYAVSRRIFDLFPAVICALFVALDFQSMLTANFLLSDTLFTVILCIFLIKLVDWCQQEDKQFLFDLRTVVVLGGWLSVLSLCRPISFLAFVPIALWMFFALREKKKYISVLICFFCLSSASMPILWSVRNYFHTGVFFFTTISSKDIFLYRAAWNISFIEKRDFKDVRDELKQRAIEKQEKERLNDGELAIWERNEGIKILKNNLLVTLWQGIRGGMEMYFDMTSFLNFKIKEESFPSKIIIFWRAVHLFLLYAGLILGSVIALKNYLFPHQRQVIYLFLVVIFYFTLFSVGGEAYGRFRVPIVPALSVISASGWGYLFNRNKLQAKKLHC